MSPIICAEIASTFVVGCLLVGSYFGSHFWGMAETGDLVRGAVFSIPAHQHESALALRLSNRQSYRYISLPQTIKQL